MKKLKKRKGASSVLILYCIVILVLISLLTIMHVSLNYNISYEQSKWNENYYKIDSYAESVVAEIDDALFNAEQQAVNYFINQEYLIENSSIIPEDIHNINKSIYNNDVNKSYDILNNTYKYLAIIYLQPIQETYGGEILTVYNDDETIYSLYYKNTFTLENFEDYKLETRISIKDILYDITIEDGIVSGHKIDFKNRYEVVNWSQFYEN